MAPRTALLSAQTVLNGTSLAAPIGLQRSDPIRSTTAACFLTRIFLQRWRPLRELETHSAAVAMVDGPRNLSAARLEGSATETHVWQGSESRPFLFAARGLLAAMGPGPVVRRCGWDRRPLWPGQPASLSDRVCNSPRGSVPPPARIVGVVCVLILLAEEFHWFALRLVGLCHRRADSLRNRLGVQVGALLTAALTSDFVVGEDPRRLRPKSPFSALSEMPWPSAASMRCQCSYGRCC